MVAVGFIGKHVIQIYSKQAGRGLRMNIISGRYHPWWFGAGKGVSERHTLCSRTIHCLSNLFNLSGGIMGNHIMV